MASDMEGMSWSGGSVKAGLHKQAGEFCAKQSNEVVPVSDQSNDASAFGNHASAEVKFRCR